MTGSLDAGAGPHVAVLARPAARGAGEEPRRPARALPRAELNLDNAFWGAPEPRDLGEALTRFGPTCVNVVARIFERIRDIDPTLDLWMQIRYLRNVWCGGSAGFKVVYVEPAAMRELWTTTSRERAAAAWRATRSSGDRAPAGRAARLARGEHGGALPGRRAARREDSWREVHRPDQEAVHLCVGKHEPRAAGARRHPPRLEIAGGGRRRGEPPLPVRALIGVVHWVQARFGLGKPVFPFQSIDDRVAALAGRREAPARWAEFAARWRDARWPLALRGGDGAEEAQAWLRECDELVAAQRADA